MRIYLDHNATAPLRPEARRAMLGALAEERGNPSSTHALGQSARAMLEDARAQVAHALSVSPGEIVFTSGGTEGNTTAILGAALASKKRVICTTPIEHSSVLRPLRLLADFGFATHLLRVGRDGRVDPQELRETLRAGNVALVSIGWANNETGVCQPMAELSAVCREQGVPLHSDAVQALGRIPVKVALVDLLTASSHKFGGPAGSGILFVRQGTALEPLLRGGDQERGLRAGTENVPAAMGCAAALRACLGELSQAMPHCMKLRERLWEGLADLPGVVRYSGNSAEFLPNTLSVGFGGIPGDALVARLDLEGVCASVGSACSAGAAQPSHVLLALGVDRERASQVVRFSLGVENTAAEIDEAVRIVRSVVLEMALGGARREQWRVR